MFVWKRIRCIRCTRSLNANIFSQTNRTFFFKNLYDNTVLDLRKFYWFFYFWFSGCRWRASVLRAGSSRGASRPTCTRRAAEWPSAECRARPCKTGTRPLPRTGASHRSLFVDFSKKLYMVSSGSPRAAKSLWVNLKTYVLNVRFWMVD